MAPAAVAAASSVESSTTSAMKTSAAEASSVASAKAGLSSERIGSRIATVIELAEGTRMRSSRKVL